MQQPLIVIQLDGKPQAKGRPRFSAAAKRPYTPLKTVRFENDLAAAAHRAMGRSRPLEGPLAVVVTALMPLPSKWPKAKKQLARTGALRPACKPDWDNFAKSLDALNGVAWRDDAQIVDGRVIKKFSAYPGFVVEIFAVEGASA